MQQIQLSPSEISELIKKRIQQFDVSAQVRTEGTIVSLKDGIVRIYGLDDVMQGEMVEFEDGTFGMALNLERDCVGAVVLGRSDKLSEGQVVRVKVLEIDKQGRIRLTMKEVEAS